MRVDILTLFPEMFEGFLQTSILKRALKNGLLEVKLWDLRQFGQGPHRQVDDKPHGGGAGMVIRVDIIDKALEQIKKEASKNTRTILLTPSGKLFTQQKSLSLSHFSNLILVCGHYEGFDERVVKLVDEQISIGDYVLTGGELPAMVIVDAVCRHIPDVLGKEESLAEESFSPTTNGRSLLTGDRKLKTSSLGLLEYPQYTRPEIYTTLSTPSNLLRTGPSKKLGTSRDKKGMRVPKILLSGNHAKIAAWRRQQALKKTKKIRPDLL